MKTVLSVDPGKTTGACLILAKEGQRDFEVLSASEIPWEKRLSALNALIGGSILKPSGYLPRPQVVVVETFRLRFNKAKDQIGSEFPATKIIGVVQAFCYIHKVSSIIYQEPSVRSRVKVLPEHSDLIVGPHVTDAYQHARYYHVTQIRS